MNNQEDKDIKLNDIPLRVKKTKNNHITFKTNSTAKTVIVALLLILSIFLIANQTRINYRETPSKKIESGVKPIAIKETKKIGKFITSGNSEFLFGDDKNFIWLENEAIKTDNYIEGHYNYKQGTKALEEMGYTVAEFKKTFPNIDINKVYSMNLIPTKVVKNKKDKTREELRPDESWWYLLIVKEDKTALAYNKTLDIRYSLKKVE